MAKFVDINSLTEKVNPDGNEQIQVSDTQKFVWKNALMNSGGFIGAILSYATQYARGNTTDRQTIISMLGQLFYNTGSRADSFFRFVCGSVTIKGGTPKQEYFGVVFYDAYYTRTYAVFFGFENGAVPVTFFQRSGNYVTDSPVDDNFVTNIINGTSWTKLGTLDFTALLKQTYGTNTQFLAPVQGSEVLLTTTIERILYALGFRGTNTNFRFLTGVNNTSETYWGVAFYNSGQSRTFTVLFGIGGSSIPVGMYQKAGNVTTQKSVDSEFIKDVLSTWTKSWELKGSGSSSDIKAEEVLVAAPTLFDENTSSTWDPTAANNLQELVNGLLYRIGVRITPDGLNLGFRVAQANGKIAIIANDQSSSDYSVFLFSGGSVIHTYLIDQSYVMEWIGNYSSDSDIIASIESNGSETGMLNLAGINNFATKAYVKPNDAVLTTFPSGYRTVIPGENLTTNLTSGTLKVQVPSLLTLQVKSGPFRDAVIDVPYGVTVQFADQVGIVYKADGVDGFTATSGRKVYTIHFVPTTSSTTNITFRAFVNVTNYK
jgi:hypothetical protein